MQKRRSKLIQTASNMDALSPSTFLSQIHLAVLAALLSDQALTLALRCLTPNSGLHVSRENALHQSTPILTPVDFLRTRRRHLAASIAIHFTTRISSLANNTSPLKQVVCSIGQPPKTRDIMCHRRQAIMQKQRLSWFLFRKHGPWCGSILLCSVGFLSKSLAV
jgi:hypothetical protein